uniref:Uncharacterized protein n=1 Tax=Aegilops tauschii TaxID=37682 RepID=N1QUU2_AEGTA
MPPPPQADHYASYRNLAMWSLGTGGSRLCCGLSFGSGQTSTGTTGTVPDDPITQQRIYGPDNLGNWDDELAADQDLERGMKKELIAKIQRHYERVKIVDEGFCFGLLDPVSNIVVSEAIAQTELALAVEEEEEDYSRGRRRPMLRCIFERSVDGLVAFLVALFPYLTNYRAVWYLNKADLDPLVAAGLVIQHRGMERTFGFLSDTTAAAVGMVLRCAAAAAQHHDPHKFALAWKILSPSLCKINTLLSSPYAARDPALIIDIWALLEQPEPPTLVLEEAWELASKRHGNLNNHPEMELQVPLLPTLRRVLLATIHGYYLEALAWLPKDKLRGSHQYDYSLLHAGHCYGPLDPVSNIIINTLWYARAYPLKLEKKIEVEAISTRALLRIALRSLYGLISFLCTRHPTLTPAKPCNDCSWPGPISKMPMIAMVVWKNPKPTRLLPMPHATPNLLNRPTSSDHLIPCSKASQISSSTMNLPTSAHCFRATSKLLPTTNLHKKQKTPTYRLALDVHHQNNLQQLDCLQVQPSYEVHVVCGVNEYAGGCANPTKPFDGTCRCSHINFLATQTAAGTSPELFFAECSNVGSKEVLLCCPVAMPLPGTEQVRCLYCEFRGRTIVHPTKESFLGRDKEFEKMLCDERQRANNEMISDSYYITLHLDNLEEDRIYGDYSCDSGLQEDVPLDDIN